MASGSERPSSRVYRLRSLVRLFRRISGRALLAELLADRHGAIAVLQDAGVAHAAIFGSVARADARAPGDIDLLIWPATDLTDARLDALIDTLGDRWVYPIHIAVFDRVDAATASSALKDAVPFRDETRELIDSYTRGVVEGYETDEEREKREQARRKAGERAVREMLAAAPEEVRRAADRLHRGSPDCMIEVCGTTLFRSRIAVRRRVAGWYVGFVDPPGTEDYGRSRIHYAIGVDARLYAGGGPGLGPSRGVGERREFRTRGPWDNADNYTNRQCIGRVIALLERAGQPSATA